MNLDRLKGQRAGSGRSTEMEKQTVTLEEVGINRRWKPYRYFETEQSPQKTNSKYTAE